MAEEPGIGEMRDNGLLCAGPGGVGYAAKGSVETTTH